MPSQTRVGDIGVGVCHQHEHDQNYTTIISSGSTSSMTNNVPTAVVGSVGVSSCGHPTIALTGSSTDHNDGTPSHRVGDIGTNSGIYVMVSGSSDSFTDEGGNCIPPPSFMPNVQPWVSPQEAVVQQNEDSVEPLTPTQRFYYHKAGVNPNPSISSNPYKSDTDVTTPSNQIIPPNCEDIAAIPNGGFSDSFQLSPNFKLCQLTTGCSVSNYRLISQLNLTEQQIVCNLRNLALNVLEKLVTDFGKPTISSGFRHGTNSSWHNKGCATDLQWGGISDSQYYDIAVHIKNQYQWCEVILEYGGNRPWIHVAYNEQANNRTNFKTRTQIANTYQPGILALINTPGQGGA